MKAQEAFEKMREVVNAPRNYRSYNEVEKGRLRESIIRKRGIGAKLNKEEREFSAADADFFKPDDNQH